MAEADLCLESERPIAGEAAASEERHAQMRSSAIASATGVSKSGVYAHFDSKADLQLATVDNARDLFIEVVVAPTSDAKGLDRLRALCESFLAYVEQVLAPALRKGDTVFMDNLRTHKIEGVREAIEAVGAKVRYLPAYSPDLNPIEMAFSKLMLRAANASILGVCTFGSPA